jgi:Spy/CpxP family protein refolding chaperone
MSRKFVAPLISFFAAAFAAGGVFMMGVVAAHAQAAPPGPPPNGGPRTADISKALKLSAQQSESVQAIMDTERAAMEELHKKRDAIAQATRQKLAKVLNAEQMGRFEEWQQAHRPPRPPQGVGGEQPPAKRRQ